MRNKCELAGAQATALRSSAGTWTPYRTTIAHWNWSLVMQMRTTTGADDLDSNCFQFVHRLLYGNRYQFPCA
jgi:hypothetical protein